MSHADESEVRIVAYDASWPARFERERAALVAAIGEYVTGSIEHVGSTAVPGLAAKPIIDIMVGVESLEASRPALAILAALDYHYFPHRAEIMHWLCKPSPRQRTHHLHLVPYRSRTWRERIAFRDHLREHPGTAAEYAELKRRLASRHRFDREAYTDEKGPFIRRIVSRFLLLVAVLSAACGGDSMSDRAPDGGEAMLDSVRVFVQSIPEALASEGPTAWLRLFEDAPAFFMASDGEVVFPGRDSAEAFLEAFSGEVSGMELDWESIRVEPLAPGIAAIAASYRETITMNDGTVSEFGGFVTGVARSRSGEWRFQHLHWSSPVRPGQ